MIFLSANLEYGLECFYIQISNRYQCMHIVDDVLQMDFAEEFFNGALKVSQP